MCLSNLTHLGRLIGETCLACRLIGETYLTCRLIGET